MINLNDRFEEAKKNNKFIIEKSYFPNNISWEDILRFIYKESTVEDIQEKNEKNFSQVIPERKLFITTKGNIAIHHPLWIKSLTGKVWEDISELKQFLIKLNNDFNCSTSFDKCEYYNETDQRHCTCDSIWHAEGMIVSLAHRLVSEHRDIADAGYIQLVGRSFWKIEGHEEICILNSGDLLLLPNKLTHEVWGDGPRSGVLLFPEEKIINKI